MLARLFGFDAVIAVPASWWIIAAELALPVLLLVTPRLGLSAAIMLHVILTAF